MLETPRLVLPGWRPKDLDASARVAERLGLRRLRRWTLGEREVWIHAIARPAGGDGPLDAAPAA